MPKKIIFLFFLTIWYPVFLFAKIHILTDDAFFYEMIQKRPNIIKENSDSPTGSKSYQIIGRNFYEISVKNWNFVIKKQPHQTNEYRYILFVWKQKDGTSMVLTFSNNNNFGTALSYTAGNPGNTYFKINIAPKAPEKWNIVIRDLYNDMLQAQFDQNFNHNGSLFPLIITGIGFSAWDGEYGLLDKIILGTDKEELEAISQEIIKNIKDYKKDDDILINQKNSWDQLIYRKFEWETVLDEFNRIDSNIIKDNKIFFSREIALSHAWIALDNLVNENYKKGFENIENCIENLKNLNLPPETWGLSYLKKLFLTREKMGNISPECIMNIGLIMIPQVKNREFEDCFEDSEYKKIVLEWEIVRTFIEVNSHGKISLKTNLYITDGVFTGQINPQSTVNLNEINPYPSDSIKKAVIVNDVIVYYTPTLTPSSSYMSNVMLDLNNNYSGKRGIIISSRGHTNPDDFMLPLHEFVHNFEFFFNFMDLVHSYRNNKNYYNEPFISEISYYEKLFSEIIPKRISNNYKEQSWRVLYWNNFTLQYIPKSFYSII